MNDRLDEFYGLEYSRSLKCQVDNLDKETSILWDRLETLEKKVQKEPDNIKQKQRILSIIDRLDSISNTLEEIVNS